MKKEREGDFMSNFSSRRFFLGAENEISEYGTQNTRSQNRQIDLRHTHTKCESVGLLIFPSREPVDQKGGADGKKDHTTHSKINQSQLVHYVPLSKETFSYENNLYISSAGSNEDFKAVAFSSLVLLKRTHHVGEEAQDHSQTYDPRGTQGLPEEAWPFAKGSCGAAGSSRGNRCGLGDREKQDSPISILRPELLGERKNLVISPPTFLGIHFAPFGLKIFLICSFSEHTF